MVAFGHTAVGVLIGVTTAHFVADSDPVLGMSLAFGVGLVSHYLADFIPHGHFFTDTTKYKKYALPIIIFDLGLGGVIFLGLSFLKFGVSWPMVYIILAVVASELPDALDAFVWMKMIKPKGLIGLEYQLHRAMHWHARPDPGLPLGLYDIWQVAVIIGAFLVFKVIS